MAQGAAAPAGGRPTSPSQELRFVGAVPGRYALAESALDRDGQLPVYACRLCSITTQEAVIIGPVSGRVGEIVSAHFDEFGVYRAKVARILQAGLVLEFILGEEERSKLATKLFLMRKKEHQPGHDRRDHGRFLPRDPRSSLTFADGTKVGCFIIDMSLSGVAISADVAPPVGSALAVGRIVGRVQRHLDVGFAVSFLQEQTREALDTLLAPAP
ncbi:PilZ domain-containing protein [Devosia sp.]|uniref:PilZ domain-containing protein n=1 Tax=Devosia sp. TaxID=1871048 RepID=UPI003265A13C